MVKKIDRDYNRFREIVRGKVKENLKKYITRGEMIGRQGKRLISIPLPQIEIPTIRFEPKDVGGIGQGNGDEGTPVAFDPSDVGLGAGDRPAEHILEVDVSLEELAEILGEELELPRIEPKGKDNIEAQKDKYTKIAQVGPESLRHFKRSYKEALKRQIATGSYDRDDPVVVMIKRDKRYRSWTESFEPESNAVIIYMMDVSGSMGEEQKEIVRTESFWIDTWLQSQYRGIETRYIIHDARAKEVDRDTFYRTRESGGTMISSAYKLCNQILDDEYNTTEWNVYPFHFSDGDNWSMGDTRECLEILAKQLLKKCNLFCYGQVESRYGSGQFLEDISERFSDQDNLITSHIADREDIYYSIQEFLGKGK